MAREEDTGPVEEASTNGSGAKLRLGDILTKGTRAFAVIGGGDEESAGRSNGPDTGRNQGDTADPSAITEKRSRGRPKLTAEEKAQRKSERSTSGPAKEKAKLALKQPYEIPTTAVEQIADGLKFFHMAAAAMLQSPELEISDNEAEKLAKAGANVARWYSPVAVSGKNGDWLALFIVLGAIYGERVWNIAKRASQNKQAKPNGALH